MLRFEGAILFLSGLIVAGCSLDRSSAGGAAGGAASASLREQNVRPGFNDNFRKIRTLDDVKPWVERFEVEGRDIFDRRHDIVAALHLEPGMRVADVGAGTGLFVPLLAREVTETGAVYAVEIVPAFLERIERMSEERGLTQVRTILCDDQSAKLPGKSVDVVFVCDTYHHFEYPRSSLLSIRRSLRPGGELVIVDFERIVGASRPWVLEHVRAGKEVFIREIEDSGFKLVEDRPVSRENYLLRFERNQ